MKRVKFRKEEMEDEIKLDKGEACDPDIALSYIDEKLQDVLGHFQKDFEDGVSSENLGSKFGGYGSFLPTYQRSPSWSNTRTPTEAHNNNRSASPNSMLPKGGWRPSLASSSTSLSGRPIASSAYSAVVPAQKASAANGKTNSATLPAQDEDSTSKSEVVKKQTNLSDSKTHKLYIRDNIENLSTQKSADIYSGLGLDVSPSSSLDDSPMNSESNDIKNSQFESPTSILQIMISYPTHDGLLLSPLSDDLICLSEKGKLWGHCGPEGMNQENLVTSVEFVHGIHDANRKVSEAKKRKSFDNVLENSHGNDNQNGSGVPSRKEIDADVNTCKELISKALKVPLLSNPYHNVVDPTKDAGRIINNPRTAVRGREAEKSSNIALEPVSTIEIDAVVRSDGNVISSGRITETKCHVVHSTEIVKEVSVADSSIESKSKKSFQRDTLLTKGGLEGMKKNHGRHRYRDFFGGIDAEEDDDETGLQEIHSPERLTDSDAVGMYGSKGLSNATKSKGLSNATKQDGSQPSNYVITNHQETPNCRSSSQTTHSLDEDRLQHLGPPNSSVVEERRHKNEEKKSFLNNHSDGGSKNAKMRNVREVDLNVSSKTVKRDDRHDDENWTVGPAVAKPGWSSSSGLSHSASGKVRDKYKNRDSKDGSKINLVSAKHSEAHTSDVSMHMGRCDSKDSLTKRKGRKLWDSDACNPQDFVQGTCDDTRRKEKKARVSKSDQKDSSASKGGGGTGGTDQVKKEKHTEQDLGTTLSLQSVKAVDSSKMDLCNSQPSVAAISSSSKVSGSHKNKSSLQELKGSPVESVSSSPLRISNMDTRTNLERKGDCKNSISFPTSSPKRSFNGENHGFSNQSSMVKKNKACNGTNDDLKFSEVDFEEKDVVEVKINESGYATHQDADVNVDPLRQASQYACKTDNSDQGSYKERKNDRQCQNSESVSNSGNGSLLRHKEKNRASKFDSDKIPLDEEKMTPEKNKCQERSSVGSDRLKKSSKKDSSAKLTDKDVKGDSQSRSGHHCGAEVTLDVMSHSDKRKVAVPNRDDRRASKELVSNKSEQTEVSPRSPITGGQNETVVFKEPVTGSERENGASFPVVDGFERERSNASRQSRKAKSHPGNLPNSTSHKVRDLDVPSPVRKDSSSQAAANAIKEARNLKHLADRLKNSGSSESTGIYFQAALKFLHAASLQELDSAKHGAMNQSRRIYSSTAKLCQFCAHEYEKLKDMASAALAYKCMEVAYMRVIYSSNSDANRYRNELQIALQNFPPGESPFSSVSDVDNLNNPTTMVDKAALTKVVGSPQVAGTHVFSSTNSSSFMHLINLAQEVNFAMEASRKSRVAFASVNPGLGDAQCKERTLYVKKALDFNFQDVDGLLRLVRVAMEAISH